jgi:hypothetical protein
VPVLQAQGLQRESYFYYKRWKIYCEFYS